MSEEHGHEWAAGRLSRRALLAAGVGALGVAAVEPVRGAPRRQNTAAPPPDTATAPAPPAAPAGRMALHVAANAPSTPTGVVVSRGGRLFVFMPRFDEHVPFTVGEVARDGRVVPYPSTALNQPDPARAGERLIHVPNGVVDTRDRLWLLDAGLPAARGAPLPGGPKLVCVDLASNAVVRRVPLDAAVEPGSSLNDLRLDADARRAYVTDQGQDGQGALIAVDLDTGCAVRRLARHASTASQDGIVKLVEGRQVLLRDANGTTKPVKGGANGIALSPDGRRLYYAPLIGRHLYAIDTAPLLDPTVTDAVLGARVEDLGEKGLTGGLLCDPQGRVLLALQEHNAVGRRNADGTVEIVAADPRLIWADTLCIDGDWLYVSAAQVNRRPEFNGGVDRQQPPYAILRVPLPA